MVRLGEVSYGWYLWHWPCLILAAVWVGEGSADAGVERTAATELAWPVAATAVAVSLALAMITHAIFENPIRRSRWLAAVPARSLAIGLVFVILPLAGGAYLDRSSNDLMDDITTATPPPPEDASADGPVVGRPTGKLIMTPKQAALDKLPETRCMGGIGTTTAPVDCRWGDRRGERVVVLVGDSHAQHWMPAMEKAAEANHWQLFHWSKSACSMADLPIYSTALKRRYRECERWRADVIKRIDELPRADLVVMARSAGYLPLDESGDIAAKSDFGDLWQRGAERTFAALTPLAERVVVMEDTPWAASPVPECLSEHLDDIDKCDFPLKGNSEHDQLQTEREKAAAGAGDAVQFLDMTRYVCPTTTCPVVDGDGVVIYRDQSHMTSTFNEALWRPLTRELTARMDDPPGG